MKHLQPISPEVDIVANQDAAHIVALDKVQQANTAPVPGVASPYVNDQQGHGPVQTDADSPVTTQSAASAPTNDNWRRVRVRVIGVVTLILSALYAGLVIIYPIVQRGVAGLPLSYPVWFAILATACMLVASVGSIQAKNWGRVMLFWAIIVPFVISLPILFFITILLGAGGLTFFGALIIVACFLGVIRLLRFLWSHETRRALD